MIAIAGRLDTGHRAAALALTEAATRIQDAPGAGRQDLVSWAVLYS